MVGETKRRMARNPKVRGSIPHGDSEFFLSPILVTRRKITFTISYRAQNLPSFLFYLLLSKVGKIYQYFRGLSQNIFPLAFVGYEMKSARFISYPKCAC